MLNIQKRQIFFTCLLAKVKLLSHIGHGDFLRSGDHHRTIDIRRLQVLHDGDVLVRSSRWGVDNEIIQLVPNNIRQKLLDKTVFARTSPNNRVVFGREHEADGHNPQIVVHVNR